MRQWTPAQRDAIDARPRRGLVVSAGAGAGKTAVLVERVLTTLLDETSPASLDQFLIVTFTRAAAENMRAQLERRLRLAVEAAADRPSRADHLEAQLAELPRARISTLHSFCLDLVVAHATELGLPPALDIMSPEETSLFLKQFLHDRTEALLADPTHARATAEAIRSLDPTGDAEAFFRLLSGWIATLEAQPDPDAFCRSQVTLWEDAAARGARWQESALGRSLLDARARVAAQVRELVMRLLRVAPLGDSTASREAFVQVLSALAGSLHGWSPESPIALPGKSELTFRKKPKSDDPLRSELDRVKEELLAGVQTLAAWQAFDVPAYFAHRAPRMRFVVDVLGSTLLRDYRAALLAERRLTFNLLEHFALRLLRGADGKPSAIARDLSEGLREVLVDEFQDISPSQDAILSALCDPTRRLGPMLFRVGDVKQSIYAFREADPSIFLGAMKAAATADPAEHRRIDLNSNFRSLPAVLEEANALFEHAFSETVGGIRYDETHRLQAGRTRPAPEPASRFSPAIEFRALFTDEAPEDDEAEDDDSMSRDQREAAHMARCVRAIGPPWRDIVVLLRKTKGHAAAIVEAFKREGIPTFTSARTEFLTQPEVLEVLALLRTVWNPFDEVALLGALRGIAGWSEEELVRLRLSARGAYRDALESAATDGALPISGKAAAFLRDLARWQAASTRQNMEDFVADLFNEHHLLERAAVRIGGDARRLNLLALLERARQFDGFARRGLGRFLQFLQDLLDRDQDFAAPAAAPEHADVVRILSIHQSKGLEFPIVVLPFLGTKFNQDDLKAPILVARDGRIALRGLWPDAPDAFDPLREEVRESRRRLLLSEELRLLYVAITRAEERVIASASFRSARESFAETQARRAELPDAEARGLSARRMADWFVDEATRRFGADPFAGTESVDCNDGGFCLRVQPPDARADDQPREASPPAAGIDARVVAQLASACAQWQSDYERWPRFPRLRAKTSVTELKRMADAADPESPPAAPAARERRAPAEGSAGGRGVGIATHRFLALCDLEELSRGRALREELARLVQERYLSPEESQQVLLREVFDFFNSDLGTQYRENAGSVRREVPFTFPVEMPAEGFGLPPVLLQGVVDAYFTTSEGGIVLIDFKTDWCGEGGIELPRLEAAYSRQLRLYRAGLEHALRRPVHEAYLVFLRARQPVLVEPGTPDVDDWKAFLRPLYDAAGLPDSDQRRVIRV